MPSFEKQNFNSNNQGSNRQEIGNSVAFNADGTVMAVGFSETTLSPNSARGTVTIYNYISNQWETGVTYTGEYAGDEFGYSVDLNDTGDLCIIGAPNFYNEIYGYIGKVYVADYTSGSWNSNLSTFIKYDTIGLGTSVSVQGTLSEPYFFASEPTATNIGKVIRLKGEEAEEELAVIAEEEVAVIAEEEVAG